MFTGLVLGLGEVVRLTPMGNELRLCLRPRFAVTDWVKGESIAVNGACLSVETFGADFFTAYASAQTLSLTNLKNLGLGSVVNLERALRLCDRLGGHLVSGHIDGLATLEQITAKGVSKRLHFRFPGHLSGQVIAQGSVALDGISLTVNSCEIDTFTVNVIPETLSMTTASQWKKGESVNFETDLIGKYVQRMLGVAVISEKTTPQSTLTLDFLREHGFS